MNRKFLVVLLAVFTMVSQISAQKLSDEALKAGRWLSQEEYNNRGEVGKYFAPTTAPEGPINAVAEFEPMQGVMVAYPFGIPMNLIVEMSEVVNVTTIVASSGQANSVTSQYESAGVNMDNVDFLIEPHDTYWTRDFGPWFIREEDKVSIINFTYNRPRPDDDIMPVNVADMLGIDYYNMPVTHTGGNYMCDGFGIAAQTELIYEENSISDDQVDQYMEDYLGVTDNFVIDDPLGDYIKHIDCWGKFLDVDKVLVSEVPESDPRHDEYDAAAEYFSSRNCAYGYPFEVVRVYAPGSYPYTPYSNSLILNNHVFLPITGSQYDAGAIAVYEEAMPGYTIHPILTDGDPWLNTDALHCRTHEIADIEMLKITHLPLFGEQEYQASFAVEAKIHAYSNEAFYTDSLLVYYSINDGDFESIVMTDMGEEMFAANIPANAGDQVDYYIHAADESGRSEDYPYVGEADPFSFTVAAAAELISFSPDTLFVPESNDFMVQLMNNGTDAASITSITESYQESERWMVGYTVPEITSYPYELAAGESIDVYIDVVVGKGIYYDSLKVSTELNQYHSIIACDGVGMEEISTSSAFELMPNPMNYTGIIKLNLEEAAAIQIEVYQMNGQLIRQLENSRLSSGVYEYQWDGRDVNGRETGQGVYLVKLQKDNEVLIEKWIKM